MGISESVAAVAGALGLCKVSCWLPYCATERMRDSGSDFMSVELVQLGKSNLP